MERLYLFGLIVVVALLLIRERQRHDASVRRIPLRIHVTGTRGKSTVVRHIAAGLRRSGRRTVAKTTGSAARLILEDGSEVPVGRPGRPGIREQQRFITWAAGRGADAVVVECMAVRPAYQAVSGRLVRPHITVLTNVRPDHLEVAGRCLEEMAAAMGSTVPAGSVVVTAERRYLPSIETAAGRRGARVMSVEVPADAAALDLFEESVVLALTVCHLAGAGDVTREDLLAVRPDPGVLRIFHLQVDGKPFVTVSAFAANEPISTEAILDRLRATGLFVAPPVFLYNHRADRPARAAQFATYLASQPLRAVCVVGETPVQMRRLLVRAGVAPDAILIGESKAGGVTASLGHLVDAGGVVIGIGNFLGMGERLVEEWARRSAVND